MRHISLKFVPWLLVDEQRENLLSVASDLIACAESDENI
jgi:hypothetical protein